MHYTIFYVMLGQIYLRLNVLFVKTVVGNQVYQSRIIQ